ncbi:MAG: glycosyltransferase family 2 protein [Candidatus Omnitrophota bacterium]
MPIEVPVEISIILVSWNVCEYLTQILNSLYETLKNLRFEVFVVDNNSDDETQCMIRKKYPEVYLIINKKNLGFAKANNQAIKLSKGKYIVLLNPDTLVLPGAINSMFDFMEKHREFGAIGPKILCEDKHTISSCAARKFPNIKSILYHTTGMGKRLKSQENYTSSMETDSLSGACMMVRRKAIDDAGLLDENFFMYAEDIDWCYRIKKSGWKIFYLAASSIVHFGERSAIKKFSAADNMMENYKAYFKYFRKHYGLVYALSYRLSLALTLMTFNIIWLARFIISKTENRIKFRGIIIRNMKFLGWSISNWES